MGIQQRRMHLIRCRWPKFSETEREGQPGTGSAVMVALGGRQGKKENRPRSHPEKSPAMQLGWVVRAHPEKWEPSDRALFGRPARQKNSRDIRWRQSHSHVRRPSTGLGILDLGKRLGEESRPGPAAPFAQRSREHFRVQVYQKNASRRIAHFRFPACLS